MFNPQKDSALRMKIGTSHVTIYKGCIKFHYYVIFVDSSLNRHFFVNSGDLVEEIHQTVNEYVGQIIRIYKGQDYIEFDWVIGPVPIE